MTKYSIKVDAETCIGCGACEAQCPDNFEMDDNSKAKVKNSEVTDLGCNKDAEDVCPVDAIKIEEVN